MAMDPAKDAVIRRHVLRSTASNYGAKLITLGTWFLLTPFILHQLGPSGYGLWVVVGSAVAYGSLLDFGISNTVIKYVAEHRARGENQQAHSLIATALCLYSVLGLAAIVISLAIAPVFPDLFNIPPEDRDTAAWLVRLMGLGVGISIPCATAMAVLCGLQQFHLNNLISTTGTILSAVATVAVLLLGGGVLGMVAVSITVTLMMQPLTIWFIHRVAPDLRFGWRGARRSLIRTVMTFSWPLFVMDVAGRLQTKTDEIVIGAFLPISAVTPYALARRLSELAQILTDQFMRVLVPLASELHAESDQVRLRAVYVIGTRLTLAIFLPVGCTLIILAQPILAVWVGPAYADSAHLVTILTLASLIDTSQWPAGSVLQGIARHRPLAKISVGMGLANVALSILLVQSFGVTGVALGTLIPTTVGCLGFVLPYSMRVIGVSRIQVVREIFLPALLPVIPTVIVLYFLQDVIEPSSLLSIMVVAGIGLFVYVIGYLKFGASEIERQTCRNLVRSTIQLAGSYFKRT
jgi:O-antigen/teichoic acid export membrane protein